MKGVALLGTKAQTLERLRGRLSTAQVLPLVYFSVSAWRRADGDLRLVCPGYPDWLDAEVIVRSSAIAEDAHGASLAGRYRSIAGVRGSGEIAKAVEEVAASYGHDADEDQILIQPFLRDVDLAGVAFTRDPNGGGHYFVVNYDVSGSTSAVQDGGTNELSVLYVAKGEPPAREHCPSSFLPLLDLLDELEDILDNDALDVEFAFCGNALYLLQVRALALNGGPEVSLSEQRAALKQIAGKVEALSRPHPYLLGEKTILGVMPDWNPAEIIGLKPRPLALSLYKELVTDSIWAYQRDNYGYRNLRSFPLLVSLSGLPYIDVRVSFNSFLPKTLDSRLARRLAHYYLERLRANPALHDRVEFDIIFSCYTLDLPQRLAELGDYGFSPDEREEILVSLRDITNDIIGEENGLWKRDLARIGELEKRQQILMRSGLQEIEMIYWLLEDCKRYGTLPFAGLARAGFIAVQLLKSLVNTGCLSDGDYEGFIRSVRTVSSDLARDFKQMGRDAFLAKYGHLRPGTYDILSPRYDEEPELYFDWGQRRDIEMDAGQECSDFALGLDSLNRINEMLAQHGIRHDVISLLNFIKGAIEGREYAKFVFTKSLSEVLRTLKVFGQRRGITAEDMSYCDIGEIRDIHTSSCSAVARMRECIRKGKEAYRMTKAIVLPPLVPDESSVWSFSLPRNEPHFITGKRIRAGVCLLDNGGKCEPAGKIAFIRSADPGYDWLFSHSIKGFVTCFGGVNSHMAIRAGELGIPAVIGAGELLFRQWKEAQCLEIDCVNHSVKVLQ